MNALPPLPGTPVCDPEGAASFVCGLFEDDEVFGLSAFSPTGGRPQGQTFSPQQREAVARWIRAMHELGYNVHYGVNPLDCPAGQKLTKAKKTDVKGVRYLHVDVDPRAGEPFGEERNRILTRLQSFVPKPTFIIDSGGGYQALWRLDSSLPVDGGGPRTEEIERRLRFLALALDGDLPCCNIDRVLRLPGTVNWPDDRKRKRGRLPAAARVISFRPELIYSADTFQKAPKNASGPIDSLPTKPTDSLHTRTVTMDELELAGVPGPIRVLIVQGHDPDEPTRYSSRSEALFAVCCGLVRADRDDEVIYSVITDSGNAISASVLEKPNPEAYARRQIRRAREDAIDPLFREMNDKHAVIGSIGGKCRVLSWEPSHADESRLIPTFQTFEDIRNRYANRLVQSGKNAVPLGKYWLTHPQRRQFEGLVFDPKGGDVVGDRLNLWRGFAVIPKPGDWSLLREHVEQVLARGDPGGVEFILKWAAFAVQYPERQAELALAFRGVKGSGKGTFARALKNVFGPHGLHASSMGPITGRFNSALRDTVLLFLDEAYVQGDQASESALKRMITEPSLHIEAKNYDAVQARNLLHIIMASNYDWVVPAGPNERRFVVFDVNDDRVKDYRYFAAIHQQLDNGGLQGFLYDLLNLPLDGFHPRQGYQTAALAEQKEVAPFV